MTEAGLLIDYRTLLYWNGTGLAQHWGSFLVLNFGMDDRVRSCQRIDLHRNSAGITSEEKSNFGPSLQALIAD